MGNPMGMMGNSRHPGHTRKRGNALQAGVMLERTTRFEPATLTLAR